MALGPRVIAELDELLLLRERGEISADEHRRRVDQVLERAPLLTEVHRAPVGRVGVISAVVWIGLGLGLGVPELALGAPQLSGWLPLLAGPAALVVVGRRHRLHRGLDWVAAAAVAFVTALVLAGFGACVAAMALYG